METPHTIAAKLRDALAVGGNDAFYRFNITVSENIDDLFVLHVPPLPGEPRHDTAEAYRAIAEMEHEHWRTVAGGRVVSGNVDVDGDVVISNLTLRTTVADGEEFVLHGLTDWAVADGRIVSCYIRQDLTAEKRALLLRARAAAGVGETAIPLGEAPLASSVTADVIAGKLRAALDAGGNEGFRRFNSVIADHVDSIVILHVPRNAVDGTRSGAEYRAILEAEHELWQQVAGGRTVTGTIEAGVDVIVTDLTLEATLPDGTPIKFGARSEWAVSEGRIVTCYARQANKTLAEDARDKLSHAIEEAGVFTTLVESLTQS